MDFITLGKRVKKYRKQAKMTQANLAESLDVSISYVSQVERGIIKVSLSRLKQIAECTGTPIQFFVTDLNKRDETYLVPELVDAFRVMSPAQKKFALEVMENITNYELKVQ